MATFQALQDWVSVNRFHDTELQPRRKEARRRLVEIDKFVRFLQSKCNETPFTVNSVIKSGSLGKGTAVRDKADIDLVVIFNGLSSIHSLMDRREYLLDKLESQVSSHGPWKKGSVKLDKRTRFSLGYELDDQEMDILPGLDIRSTYGSAQRVYREMEKDDRLFLQFSASLAFLQVEFVKEQGTVVKRVVRLLKYWKKECHLDIRSYTLELVTIYARRQSGNSKVNTRQLMLDVVARLSNCDTIKVAFDDNYVSRDYTRDLASPYVLDPANPYMNTLYRVDTEEVSEKATELLRHLSTLKRRTKVNAVLWR